VQQPKIRYTNFTVNDSHEKNGQINQTQIVLQPTSFDKPSKL